MMKKRVLLFLLSVLTLMGCSESSVPDAVGDSAVIRLRSSLLSASVGSRVPLSGDAITALVPSAKTDKDVNLGYVDGVHAVGTMTFSGSATVGYDLPSLGADSDIKSTFPLGDQVYLFGLYPSEKDAWALTNTSASMTFTGKEDVMVAPELLVKRSDVDKGVYQTLAFSHLLTRLEVKLKAKDADAIASVGSIKSIRLVADGSGSGMIKNQITFTPAATDNAAVFTESATLTALPFYGATVSDGKVTYTDTPFEDQSYELTTSPVLLAYAMVAPVVADPSNDEEYYLAIERGDGSVDYVGFDLVQSDNITPFSGSAAGYCFSVVISYTKEYIEDIVGVVGASLGSQNWLNNDDPIVIN